MNNNMKVLPMSDYAFEKFCESNTECGYMCTKCYAFAANQIYHNV